MKVDLLISKNRISGKMFNIADKISNKDELDYEYTDSDIEVLEIVDSLFKYKNVRLYGNTVDTLVVDDFAFSHAKVRGLMGYNDLVAKNNAFSHSDIEEVSNISYADVAAFYNSSLHKVSFKDISYIGDKAFAKTSIECLDLNVLDNVMFGENVFSDCSKLVRVTTNLIHLYCGMFYKCTQLKDIDLSKVKIFDTRSMNKTGVEKIRLDDVVYIGNRAFGDCERLEEVYIGRNIRYIHPDAFAFCKSLKKIELPRTMRGILEANKYFFCDNIIYYDVDEVEDFQLSIDRKSIYGVNRESDFYYIPNDIEKIDALDDDFDSSMIILGRNINNIGSRVFTNCQILNTLPNTLTYIGEDAFNGARYSDELVIPSKLCVVQEAAFRGIITKSVIIGNTIEELGDEAFADSTIAAVKIGRSLKKIGRGVFRNTLIESLYIPPQVKDIDFDAFIDMPNLKVLYISELQSKVINNKLKDKFVIYDKFD